MAVLTRACICGGLLVLTAACRTGPEQWGPFGGRVVDGETGRPIAGVHVVVMWERDNPNPVHWTQSFYDAEEAVTDENGQFDIPRRWRLLTLFVSAPRFAVFAPGYVPQAEDVTPSGGRPYVDATVLRMRPLKTVEERCRYQPHGVAASVPTRHVPRFTAAVQEYLLSLRCAEIRQ